MTVAVQDLNDVFKIARDCAGIQRPKKIMPAVPWIVENYIDPVSKTNIKLEPYQRRILRHVLKLGDGGSSRYNTVIWSQPKKSGKTTIAGAVGCFVACNLEAPNEILCVANDQEQSASRIFAAMMPTLGRLGWHIPQSPRGTFAYNDEGTICKAITTRYEGEAGGNQGLSLWSELWAYSGERLNRLWDELTPPPTRKFRMRWIETYAGFRQESLLLYRYYRMIFAEDEQPGKKPVLNAGVEQVWDDIPAYVIPQGGIFVFWDHEHRMPWQTDDYYRSQADLRPNTFKRLHGNYWVDSSESFISNELWNESCRRQGPLKTASTYAIDGSKNGACTALVGCVRIGSTVHTTDVHIWEAKNGRDIDQNDVMKTIVELYEKGLLKPPLYYDPYQLVKLTQDLQREYGIPCEEFSQGQDRIKADTSLRKLYENGAIVNWNHPGLSAHVMAAQAKSYGSDKEEIRIIKPDAVGRQQSATVRYQYVDAAVAQSMAAFRAYSSIDGAWTASGI